MYATLYNHIFRCSIGHWALPAPGDLSLFWVSHGGLFPVAFPSGLWPIH